MSSLPQFLEEDIQSLDEALNELLDSSESEFAMIVDKGGFSITHCGKDRGELDTTTLGALSAAAFSATQGVAKLMNEENFNCIYHQGEKESLLVFNIDDDCLMVIIFSSQISAGAVKYYAKPCSLKLADAIQMARNRAPGEGIDLSKLNIADSEELFRRKSPPVQGG